MDNPELLTGAGGLELDRLSTPSDAANVDRRIRKTRQRLQAGLLLLMKEKPISQITMREICRRADVGRSTPYTHYRDVEDILEQMENALYNDLSALLNQYPSSLNAGQEAWLTSAYSLAQRNGLLLEVLLCYDGDQAFMRRLLSLLQNGMKDSQSADIPYSNWRSTFLTGGINYIVQQWVSGGGAESPEELARLTISFLASN